MTGKQNLPPINFEALARELLSRADTLVPAWLSGGELKGKEWVCGSVRGGAGTSCSVNLDTGAWADFQTGEKGGDLISLYAACNDLSMGKAAVQVARDEALEDVAGVQRDTAHKRVERPPPPPAEARPRRKASDESWTTQRPVPAAAVELVHFEHQHRQQADIEHVAEYRVGDDLHGYVVRFRTSTGGKDTLPRTWCVSQRDGCAKWHWRQWDEPRPLFLPGRALPAGRTVVLVEGEVKAEVLQTLLDREAAGVYCVASWPGGCKVWQKADWAWLAGQSVLLWPDCDAKRKEPPRAEVKATAGDELALQVLKQAQPLLPAEKQPGMEAMLGIGAHLRDVHACTVQMLPIPAPGAVADGWDCKDAINTDGWTGARVLEFFGQAQPLQAASAPAEPKAGGQGGKGSAHDEPADDEYDGDDAFEVHLRWVCAELKIKRHELGVNRNLVITALRKAPALVGCVGFDDLRDGPCTRKAWPWRDEPGPLVDDDDLQLSDWLVRTYHIKSAPRSAVAEALETVAGQNRFHPFREWLQAQQWDGKERLGKWLIHVLRHDPAKLDPKLRRYLQLVGEYIVLGHVYRVMEPGCKFDYSVVLEGKTGRGKSTLVEELIGPEFYSDTHFDIGAGKDGMEQLGGILAYELSEMTAFRRADSEAVKQFFSTKKDRYRGAYGRYVKDHPRQCVIWCTTNKRQYLFDITGNRRFWPVWVEVLLNIPWVRKWRHQLFAEALVKYRQGARAYPDDDEERLYFRPEQEKRLVETSVQSRLYDLLTRPGAPSSEAKSTLDINQNTQFLTIDKLVVALGVDPGKSSALLEGQVRDWLLENGWVRAREGSGARRWGYRQPDVWPPAIADETPADAAGTDQPGGAASDSAPPLPPVDDDEPF